MPEQEVKPLVNMFGAVLIMIASSLAGFYKARQYALRPRQLRELIAALQRLMTEINYGLTPLPDAMSKMGAQTKEPAEDSVYARRFTDGTSARAHGQREPSSWCGAGVGKIGYEVRRA